MNDSSLWSHTLSQRSEVDPSERYEGDSDPFPAVCATDVLHATELLAL